MLQIKIEVDDVVGRLLATLGSNKSVESVVAALIDHAAQGVYRPGAWERGWVIHAFGDEFLKRLEPGDPWGRRGIGQYYERPTERPRRSWSPAKNASDGASPHAD